MKANVYLVFTIFLLNSLTSHALDCPSLPSDAIIVSQLRAIGNITATVVVNLLDKNYTCQAKGTTLSSFSSLSIIARYTFDQGQTVSDRISQFELTCTSERGNFSWIGVRDSLADAPDGYQDLKTRNECLSCSSAADNKHHCSTETTPCDPPCLLGTCDRSVGICQCFVGLAGRSCENDIDECASGNGGCSHNCTNTIGSFKCSCRAGYELSEDGLTCQEKLPCDSLCLFGMCGGGVCQCYDGITGRNCSDDIDECAIGNGGCSHNCTNTFGSFMCSCRTGYELSEDGFRCRDIDECAIGNGRCSHNCTNTFGSFKCSCRASYKLSEDGFTCQETISCDPPCLYGTCNESAGVCRCYEGFTGRSCSDDVDECAIGNGGCSHNCTNIFGSFKCSCRAGYKLSSDGFRCQDIDECAIGNGGCSHNCTNTFGSFICSCGAGYKQSEDGFTCQETKSCDLSCLYGTCNESAGVCRCYDGITGRSCSDDIDECASGNGGCSHTCSNNFGSFICSCKNGYTLSSDGFRCQALSSKMPKDSGPCSGRGRRYYYNSTSKECESFLWGGCGGNANRFLFKHACEEESSECPPICSPEFCVTKRSAICTIRRSATDSSCPGGCVVSNCLACFYHDDPLPSIDSTSCPASCTTSRHKDCMRKWGLCMRQYFKFQKTNFQRTKYNYKCWEYPC